MSKNRPFGSKGVTGGVHPGVRFAEGGYNAVAAAFGRAEAYKQDLVIVVMDDFPQLTFELDLFLGAEVALEDRVLKMIPEIAADLEHPAQAFVVGDIITDQIRDSHRVVKGI
jgi:hypothetical protein